MVNLARERKFKRYDVAHCLEVGGQMSDSPVEMRLATLSRGGCAFFASTTSLRFRPPKEIICTFFSTNENNEFVQSEVVVGHLIYLIPINRENGRVDYYYGIKFLEEDQAKLDGIVSILEDLEAEGVVQPA